MRYSQCTYHLGNGSDRIEMKSTVGCGVVLGDALAFADRAIFVLPKRTDSVFSQSCLTLE